VWVSNAFLAVRSAISIVPQSPDLFEGTLRENIDPVGAYQDADIWTALSQVDYFSVRNCVRCWLIISFYYRFI
jgi:ABC-type multidrug transport system fused ATPase/permease subunit